MSVLADTGLTPAQRDLIDQHLWVIDWAVKRSHQHLLYDEDDARQDAWLGLARAAQTHNPRLGTRFSTHACNRARTAIQHGAAHVGGVDHRRHIHRGGALPHRPLSIDAPVPGTDDLILSDVIADQEPVDNTDSRVAALMDGLSARDLVLVTETRTDAATVLGILPVSVGQAKVRLYRRLRTQVDRHSTCVGATS